MVRVISLWLSVIGTLSLQTQAQVASPSIPLDVVKEPVLREDATPCQQAVSKWK
jgi:hypothetical protein